MYYEFLMPYVKLMSIVNKHLKLDQRILSPTVQMLMVYKKNEGITLFGNR
jgi:hypothetical protein